MDLYFIAPDAGGNSILIVYEYFNAGVSVDYSFLILVPTAGQTFEDLRQAAITNEAAYRALHSYTVANTQRYYPGLVTSTVEGIMSATDKVKLDGFLSRVASSASRSIVTGTGATGFQVSSTRDAFVNYSLTVATSVTIGGATNVSGTVLLEIAPTNSATPSDWVEVGRFTNGQLIALALALSSGQTLAGQISAMIPAGYYAKLRSINNSGTPTFTYNSGQEILL